MRRLNEFADDDIALEGEKVKIEDVIDKEIVLYKFRVSHSRYEKEGNPEYLTLQFSFEESGPLKVLFTGSQVMIRQMKKYENQLPFVATIVKVNRYFALK